VTRIVTFGNCQAHGIARLLAISLPDAYEEPTFFSNNRKTGRMESPDRIIASLTAADVVVFQPLKAHHGPLSEENLRGALDDSVTHVSFPYLFNSGIAGLCRAANAASEHSYGRIYGDEVVRARLDSGVSAEGVTDEFLTGELRFDLRQRFDRCVKQLRKRESATDIVLSDFIVENHRARRLFLTHNHPTTALLAEICAQLRQITGLPIDVEMLRRSENINLADHAYQDVDCRISPHDLEELGCGFEPDPDWDRTGRRLIEMIAREWDLERSDAASLDSARS
jgi:hypothetical protein